MKTLHLLPFSVLFILSMFYSCAGQQPQAPPDRLNKMKGNPLVMHHDQHNNYWFAIKDQGVYRYNQKGLTLFTVKDGLCSDGVIGIQEDKAGNIYFDTFDGVCRFDGAEFTTIPFSCSRPECGGMEIIPR